MVGLSGFLIVEERKECNNAKVALTEANTLVGYRISYEDIDEHGLPLSDLTLF